jgi:hypothetical protein
VLAALAQYAPADCRAVSRRLRSETALTPFVDKLVAIYRNVIAEHKKATPADPRNELRATGHYLRRLTSMVETAELLGLEATGRAAYLADAYQPVAALAASSTNRP